ncbi:MAG: UvrD-helicase domain-containing protein [Bifidobacteriaceae bacterium]|nr:UvrD-helicase domain-containing protein [Bifidobacteriaceae bacterium]MCI1914468.1 UvrD-helicase domain-containing protein [Bifidobacteriaceae bacterium]
MSKNTPQDTGEAADLNDKLTPEQRAVISADSRSDVLVVAGAGSGKTFTMTERIIALMTAADPSARVPANSILGLTFTNKAAQELQSRVTERVSETLNGTVSRVEALTMRPDVMTYDAFFQHIVRQYGLLVGVDQSVMPLSDAGRYELASRVVAESMADLFSGPDDDDVSDQPTSRFDALVHGILKISDECLSYMIDEDHLSVDAAVDSALTWNDAFIAKTSALVHHELELDPEAAEYLTAPSEPSVKSSFKKEEKRLPELAAKNHRRALFRTNHLLEVAQERRRLLKLAKIYNERKREEHFAEFSDFAVYALQLLVRFPSIGEVYRRHYTHVFLDEYQDTSTTQAKLIARLFHPSDSQQHSRVTAVGDPFQSIYAWRGASPGAFTLFQSDFDLEGTTPSSLTFSVRNPQRVLDLANVLTLPLRKPEYLTRKGGRSSSEVREVDVNKLNVLDTLAHPATQGSVAVTGYSTRKQEAAAIAAFARKYSQRYKDDAETPVAVLVRSKSHMSQYAQALEAAGLSYEVVGFSDIMSKPEVQDLFSLLTVATDHTASSAAMRLLASPRYGLSGSQLRDLARFAEQLNVEQQYAALRTAGYGTGEENEAERSRLVHEHRDIVPNLVTLIDVVLDPATLHQLSDQGMDRRAVEAIAEFSRAVMSVESVQNTSVSAALHEAIEALDLDVDLVVHQAMQDLGTEREETISRAGVSSSLDAITDMVATYAAELPEAISPTLRGYVQWVEALEKDPDEPVLSSGRRADVVLMTIHQAKGLGWKAVAVAGMTKEAFPSSKSVTFPEGGISPDGESGERYFTATSEAWIEDAAAVPAPMRSDARILPRFPHAAMPNDPLGSLDVLDSVESLDAEVYETDKEQREIGQSHDFLSLREEYGSRAHADERRLAYVAVTRSKNAVMLSYSGHQRSDKPSEGVMRTDLQPDAAGVFWKDSFDFVSGQSGARVRGGDEDEWKEAQGAARQCRGVASGADAEDLEKILMEDVAEITDSDIDEESGKALASVGSWPVRLDDGVATTLKRAASVVRSEIEAEKDEGNGDSDDLDDSGGPNAPDDSVDESLLERAKILVAQTQRGTQEGSVQVGAAGDVGEDESALDPLRRRVSRVLPTLSLGTTQLQRLASLGAEGAAGESEEAHSARVASERTALVGILRPVPQPPNSVADLGTRFHSWAQEFLDPEAAIPVFETGEGEQARKLLTWQHRLADSEWAHRPVESVENSYVIDVFGLRVVAKMDAVFHGWYRGAERDSSASRGESSEPRYTIVDWKTGRKPAPGEASERAMLQLDVYRIALHRNLDIPLSQVDACLYYINRESPQDRAIFADVSQTQEDIERRLLAHSALLQRVTSEDDE